MGSTTSTNLQPIPCEIFFFLHVIFPKPKQLIKFPLLFWCTTSSTASKPFAQRTESLINLIWGLANYRCAGFPPKEVIGQIDTKEERLTL